MGENRSRNRCSMLPSGISGRRWARDWSEVHRLPSVQKCEAKSKKALKQRARGSGALPKLVGILVYVSRDTNHS